MRGCEVFTKNLSANPVLVHVTPGDATNPGRSEHWPVKYVPCLAKYLSCARAASTRSHDTRSFASETWQGPVGALPGKHRSVPPVVAHPRRPIWVGWKVVPPHW